MIAYYNEIDPYAAQWLRNLIAAGHIAPGDVDERSIADVQPDDLRRYTQAHFFAGIGGWAHALRLAGWRDDRSVWTGSCPCQPFSAAGKRKGVADERHLWPEFHRLIRQCRPSVVFGEQVASKDGRLWLAGVRADLEALAYGVGSSDLCAAGVGAPHIRQRLWWVADSGCEHSAGRGGLRDVERSALGDQGAGGERQRVRDAADDHGADGGLADSDGGHSSAEGLQRSGEQRQQPQDGGAGRFSNSVDAGPSRAGRDAQPEIPVEQLGDDVGEDRAAASRLGDAAPGGRMGNSEHAERGPVDRPRADGQGDGVPQRQEGADRPGSAGKAGFWDDFQWVECADGKARRVGAGIQPLAHGVPARMGKLRAAGNAIIPPLAAEFIAAFMEARP